MQAREKDRRVFSVSIVIPAYNAEKWISEAIESVLTQSHPNFELILINDGSCDDTGELMRKYADLDDRIRIFDHENWGMGRSLNHAIEMAANDWIVRMDADDVMLPTRIERQITFIQENADVAVASCFVYYIDKKGRFIGRYASQLKTRSNFYQMLHANEPISLHHPGVIMRRDVVMEVGGYRPQFWPAEDMDLWNRIAEQGYLILVQPEYLLKYRVHGSSVSRAAVHEMETKVDWVTACMVARREGRPEPTLTEFKAYARSQSFLRRMNAVRRRQAKVLYKSAAFHYSARRYRDVLLELLGSMLLDPGYCSSQLWARYVRPLR